MRILMLGNFDPATNGASKVHFFEMADAFARQGHRVDALTPSGLSAEAALEPGVRLVELPLRGDESSLVRAALVSMVQLVWLLFVLRGDHDAVYIRWRLFPALLVKAVALFRGARPLVVAEHNGWVELEYRIQRGDSFLSKVARWLQVADARGADLTVAVTDGIRDRLVKAGIAPRRIFVQGNGTNVRRFRPLEDRDALRAGLAGRGGTVLGFMGTISKWQGLDDLLDAFERAAAANDDIVLLVVGSGMYEKEFKARCDASPLAGRIVMRPHVAYERANEWMNAMDIAFAPKSKALDSIGYSPLKIRDYAAAGLPVVSTRVRGIAELEPHGWLRTYDPDEPGALAALLGELLADRAELAAMGRRARAYAEAEFSWDEVAANIARAMNDMKDRR